MAAAIVLSGQVRPLPSSLPLSLLLLLLLCCSGTSWGWSTSRGGAARECGFDGKLEALEPRHKVQSEVLRAGQLLIVPQGYLVATKAQGEGFQYIAFETNPDTMVSHVAGKNSVLSDLPAAVIASSYAISMEEAAELKNGRKHELAVLTPAGSGSYQQGQAGSAQQ
ncbi:legumin1 [Zea mays]|uniref:Legumin1 n=1 Tax=Zea mays TaxID=4577 RepID=A0A1D6LI07_MAIZE|nr:legumin1 [Zea mays]